MTDQMIQELREEYLSWSGGFRPDEDDRVGVWVETASPADLPKDEIWAFIHQWMAEVTDDRVRDDAMPTPDFVVGRQSLHEPQRDLERCHNHDESWIIEWRDRGMDDIVEIANTAQEAEEAIRRILAGETVVDESLIGSDGEYPAEAERPAFTVLSEGENPIAALQRLQEPIRIETENGELIIRRCRGNSRSD